MTQEEKELLLKDLCARLPYEVKGRVYTETTNGKYDISGDMIFFDTPFDVTLDDINTSTEELHVVAIGNEDTVDFIEDQQICGAPFIVEEFEPYLRPMSNMTEEEENEYRAINCYEGLFPRNEDALDYVLSHHLDFRGLIPIGLALEAPEGMYKLNKI